MRRTNRRQSRTAILMLILALAVAGQAAAETYYVDTGHASASDANPGSETLPWKTVQYAVNSVSAGDVVIVKPGQYDQKVTITRSGAPGQLIALRAEPSRQARVKGFVLQADYISIEGFEITNSATTSHGIYAGEPHRGTARTGCRMIDNYIHDIDGTAIWAGVSAVASGNLMQRVFRGFMVGSGTVVENNEVDTLVNSPEKTQYAFFVGDDITFRGNYFHGAPMQQMASWGVDFFTTWDQWIFGPSHRILIENNRCFNATHASEPTAELHQDSSDITYRNNLFVNTVYVGVLCKQWTNITVANNTFINCGAYPIWFQSSREVAGALVRNNLIAYRNHVPVEGGPVAESGIRNNLYPSTPLDCDYNMFWGCVNRGYGTNDFTAEPQFVDPDNGDFSLKLGSPGIDAGTTIAEITIDLLGVARPQRAAYDIGAYELPDGVGLESWSIVVSHGGVEIVEPIAEGYVEPRGPGIRRLKTSFSAPLDPSTVDVSIVSVTGQVSGDQSSLVQSVRLEGDRTLVIVLSATPPNADWYTVEISDSLRSAGGLAVSGDRNVRIGCLASDFDGSGAVTGGDVLGVRTLAGQAVAAGNARADIDASGEITGGDMLLVRRHMNTSLP